MTSKNGAISLEASTIMSIKHCTFIDNAFQNHGVIYALNKCILNISDSMFVDNLVENSAMIWLQLSYLLLHAGAVS